MSKKLIKLINNERRSYNLLSHKASSECASDSYDVCTVDNYDHATCSNYAYDSCGKDYSACYNGADDICSNIDNNAPCHGAGVNDIT